MNGATSASPTSMMITASPPSNVAVARLSAEVHHAVRIASRLGLRPVRDDSSQLPTAGNPFSHQPAAERPWT
jgi:hypothetical protein